MSAASPLILMVEDELPIRKFLGASLASADYRLEEASTGHEALKKAADAPPDLVILDLGLPDMDGQDLLQRLREWLTVPIIILSARDQEQQKIAALDNGARLGYLPSVGQPLGPLWVCQQRAVNPARPGREQR
jgi:two-component system KDP operon response regulator KdpE